MIGLRSWRRGILALLTCLPAACAVAPRRPAPPMLFSQAAPVGFAPDVRTLSDNRKYFMAHLAAHARALRAAAGGGPIHVLALSGGGSGGAFGAGALYGLSQAGKRSDFQVVTGVSAGALLAPFAFLGPKWNPQLKDAFDSHRTDHLLKPRGLGFLFHSGFYLGTPLVHLVDHFCTDRMIRAVAARAAKGRLLLVATTDLDKEESVIWNMGAIAEHGGKAARKLFCKVLVASASIPGVFPPVLIHVQDNGKSYDEMHVDGSTTLPLFFGSEIMDEISFPLPELKGAETYVIVNGPLSTEPKTTPRRPTAVLSRSFSAAMMSASRRAVLMTADFAHRYGMRFHFTYLPMIYPYRGPLDFSHTNMHALFQYGARCAEAGHLWTTIGNAVLERQLAGSQPPVASDACPAAKIEASR